MDADMVLAEILQNALDIDADASAKKHKMASGTQEFGYQQGRADTARIFCARGIEFAQAWRTIRDQYNAIESKARHYESSLHAIATMPCYCVHQPPGLRCAPCYAQKVLETEAPDEQ